MIITRPNFDNTTNYLFKWSQHILDFAEAARIKLVDISGKKVTKSTLESYIRKIQPTFIMINGHGNNDYVCGHDNQVLVKKDENEVLFKNSVVYARSCSSAEGLGNACALNQNTTYIGYTGDYWFMFDEDKLFHPLEDQTAKKFLDLSNYIAISLLKGYTANEANRRSKNLMKQQILRMVTSTASTDDQSMLPLMIWNYNHQVCLGDGNVKIR